MAGFTLIEMIMVIAILGLMMVLMTVKTNPVSPATDARAAAEGISGALRAARAEAVMSNRSVQWTIDLARRRYRWGHMAAEALPNDVQLELLTGADELVSATAGNIVFHPDGSSTGGRVSVIGGNQTWWVGIDWLSGRVSVVQKPR